MHVETFRAYCISKACVTEDFPFNQSTLVFKLMGKMFALTDLEKSFSITLKCDPEKAVVLRENYEAVKPA